MLQKLVLYGRHILDLDLCMAFENVFTQDYDKLYLPENQFYLFLFNHLLVTTYRKNYAILDFTFLQQLICEHVQEFYHFCRIPNTYITLRPLKLCICNFAMVETIRCTYMQY